MAIWAMKPSNTTPSALSWVTPETMNSKTSLWMSCKCLY